MVDSKTELIAELASLVAGADTKTTKPSKTKREAVVAWGRVKFMFPGISFPTEMPLTFELGFIAGCRYVIKAAQLDNKEATNGS